jgi:hypothetical protein
VRRIPLKIQRTRNAAESTTSDGVGRDHWTLGRQTSRLQMVTEPIGSSSECHLDFGDATTADGPPAEPGARRSARRRFHPGRCLLECPRQPTIATAAVKNAAVNEWVSFAPTKKGAA